MANSALGAALQIPQSAIDAIKKADDKLKDIQTTAASTAAAVKTSFADMTTGTNPFIQALDQIIAKLGTINAAASNAGSGLGNMTQGLGNIGSGASQAVQDINKLINQLSSIGGSGASGIMQAVNAFNRMQDAMKGSLNIAQLKDSIAAIDKQLKDTTANLDQASQDHLVKQKRKLQDELKYQQQTYDERVIAFQKALDRMTSAEQTYANKQRKAYGDQAKNHQQSNYQHNTTYQGALDFSASANTLNRQVKAIEYLKEARMKLSTADADYKQKLAVLNAAIDQHNQKLREAGINSRSVAEQTSYMAGYMERWAQRMKFAFSVGTVKSFVEQIADVRGQFELSERSLEAILQNKPKADEIFNKTVELAVKSPFRIKDLVDYTRQLSAYRIESDKLYDTTKRLADVSAGLGVDMGRLILAYGQVKAAAYLRGSEVRQFTEAGINMYGELQDYFKEVKGEAYTTAQIVDMISKKKVTFEDVEAIFQRMTDKGGTFYNMQEIQADTLSGKISNLKDAFDVMLNDIGKANEGTMKNMVDFGTSMLDNWQALAVAGKALAAVISLIFLQSVKTGTSLKGIFSASMAASATQNVSTWTMLKNGISSASGAVLTFGKNLKYVLASNAWLIAIAAVVQAAWTAGEMIYDYYEKTEKANEENVKAQGAVGALAASYKELANAASQANGKISATDLEKNTNSRRAALQKLIDLAAQDGLSFNIDVANIDSDKLDAKFNEIKNKYKAFIDDINVIEHNYAKNDNWNTWFTDGLDDNAKDYKDAVVEVLSMSSQMELAVSAVNANYDKANKETQQYFDTIRAGQKDGESNIDYWKRMSDALQQINLLSTGSDYISPEWLKGMQGNIADMIQGFNDINTAATNLEKDFDAVLGAQVAKYKNDPIQIQAIIDKTAAAHDWNEYEKALAYRHFGINVNIDKSGVEKQVSWVDDYISDFFAKKKYGITLSVKSIDDDEAFEEFLDKGDQASKAAKAWKEVEKRLATVGKNSPTITVDDSIRKIFKASEIGASQMTISVSKVKARVKELKQAATQKAIAFGVNPFEKENKKTENENAKNQRDILQERISLLKDYNSKYEELQEHMNDVAAQKEAQNYFRDAAKNVGWNIDDIVPDAQSVIKEIKQLATQTKDITKRGNYLRIAADIQAKWDKKYNDQQLEEAKTDIENVFSQLDLFKKLKEEGLPESIIKNMNFGDLTTSFEDARKRITEIFESKYGKDHNSEKWGDKETKEYEDAISKLDKKIAQDQISQAQELIKEYKTRLSDQLQLDKKYVEDRAAIMKNIADPDLQKDLLGNLELDYKKKTDENTWKSFQNSDMYIRLFDNLEQFSTKALDAMAARMQQLRQNLKDLDPMQLKSITEQINKVNEVRNSRNPFKAFTSGLKEMIKASKDLKKLGGVDKYVELNTQKDELDTKIQKQNAYVLSLQQEYDEIVKNKDANQEEVTTLKLRLNTNKSILANLKSQGNAVNEQINTIGKVMTEEEKAKEKFSTSVTDITTMVSSMGQAFNSLLQGLGNTDATLSNSVNLLDHAGQAVASFYQKNWAGLVANAVGAIGDIVNLATDESAIDSKLESLENAVNSLQYAYEKLKKAIDNAFSSQDLYDNTQEAIKNLKNQQSKYYEMIRAENSRKNKDDAKILEYDHAISDLEDTIKELSETLSEELGGFGSQANYKSAAEAFAEAWVDAFNEGSDALDALNDKFDEYFNNLITKQITQRATSRFIEPILEAFDEAVSEGSEGGNNGLDVTADELANLKKLKDENLAAYNKYLENMMQVLNVTPTGSSNISSLQQGIQSVTESTAQALESVLNSMRFYLATQQADVRIIRDTLLQRVGQTISSISQDSTSSPVLIELRLQTTILTNIRDTLSSCVKGGHKQGRNGIKVFMN